MAVTQTKSRSTARKAPPANGAAPRAAAPKAAPKPGKPVAPKAAKPAFDTQQWQQMVATAAYLRAEARGFVGGSPEQDWFEAEAEVAARLAKA
jgi:hypothetical protein